MSEETAEEVKKRFLASNECQEIVNYMIEKLESTGWTEHIKEQVKQQIRHKGIQHAIVDDLSEEIKPEAYRAINMETRREVYELVKQCVKEISGLDNI